MKFKNAFPLLLFLSMIPNFSDAQVRIQKSPKSTPGRSTPAYMSKVRFFEENAQGTKVILKNGMTVLVNEFRAAPLVATSARIKAGFANEPDDLAGISHLIEHLFLNGTITRAPGTISKEIQMLGGISESRVQFDHTTYDLVAPSAQWKKAFEIEADALQNPLFDPEELRRAAALLAIEGIAGLEDHSDAYFADKLLELGFTKHKIDRAGFANAEVLKSLTREKLIGYHRKIYAPANIILVVAGDVTTSEVLNEVIRLYDKERPDVSASSAPAPELPQSAMRYGTIENKTTLPQILMGFHAPSLRSPDYPAFQVLNCLLGIGEASAMVRRLRDQKKMVTRIQTSFLALADVGYFTLQMEAAQKDIDRSEIAAVTEMELAKRGEPDEEAMERALALLEREYWQQLETVSGRAHVLAHFESLGDWKKMNGYLARLRQVKPADVVRAAEKYLVFEQCSLLEAMPARSEARNLTAEIAFKTLNDLADPSADQEASEREKETVAAVAMPDNTRAFKGSEVRYALQRASVLRGPELYIREDHTSPLIHMGFFYPGGVLFEKRENSGITALMLHSMMQGTKDRSQDQIQRQLALYGTKTQLLVDKDYFGILISLLSRNVEGVLGTLVEIIQSPKFDKDEVARQKERQLAQIQRQPDGDTAVAIEALFRALFPDHAYALNPLGTEQSLATLDSQSVRDWHKLTVEHRKPIVVIIGDTQGTSLASYFVRNFSGSRFQDVKLPEAFPKPFEQKSLAEKAADRSTSLVLLGFQAPPFGDEDTYALTVLQNFLGGIGGRLVEQLRDRLGIVSSISVEYQGMIRGGITRIAAEMDPTAEDVVLKAVADEIRRVVEGPTVYREYRAAINAAVGRFTISQQGHEVQIESLVRTLLAGKGMEWIQEYGARLQEVKQEDLSEIARRILNLGKAAAVRFHGKAKS
jgi:zinc protease